MQQRKRGERKEKKKKREDAQSVQGGKRQKIKRKKEEEEEEERRITKCKRGKKEKSCLIEKERKNIMFSCHFSGSHGFLIIYNNVIEQRCWILENWYEELSKFSV